MLKVFLKEEQDKLKTMISELDRPVERPKPIEVINIKNLPNWKPVSATQKRF